jgi:hypothetical protein
MTARLRAAPLPEQNVDILASGNLRVRRNQAVLEQVIAGAKVRGMAGATRVEARHSRLPSTCFAGPAPPRVTPLGAAAPLLPRTPASAWHASMGGLQSIMGAHMGRDPGQYLRIHIGISRMAGRPRPRRQAGRAFGRSRGRRGILGCPCSTKSGWTFRRCRCSAAAPCLLSMLAAPQWCYAKYCPD